MSQRYVIRPIRYYKNIKTGQSVSLYTGSLPGDRADWKLVTDGFGWWDSLNGTMHGTNGQTRDEVVARIRKFCPSFVDHQEQG